MPKISIIIGAYKAHKFIEECLYSIQSQTAFTPRASSYSKHSISSSKHSNSYSKHSSIDYEILIGIDGCQMTLDKVNQIKYENPGYLKNTKVFYYEQNHGVYITFNSLLTKASGSHVLFFGADDIMFPDMVEKCFQYGAPLVVRHHGIQFLEKSVFDITGGFMPWRISADTEHLSRIERYFGQKVPKCEYLYTYRQHPGQLTKSKGTALNSQLRQTYVELINSQAIPIKIQPQTHPDNDTVIANDCLRVIDKRASKDKPLTFIGIASIPERVKSLKQTVDSLIDQVDHIFISLNRYKKVPDYLEHPKITSYLRPDADQDLGDIGKFLYIFYLSEHELHNKYLLTADDDLIYEHDYVKHITDAIEKYKRKNIISMHGRIFTSLPIKSYYKDPAKFFPCLYANLNYVDVQVAGTGVMGFYSSTIKLLPEHFPTANMADIHMAIIAAKKNIPLTVIPHRKEMIKESRIYDRNISICKTCAHSDTIQTSYINDNISLFNKPFKAKKLQSNITHFVTTRLIYHDKDMLKHRAQLMADILIPALKAQVASQFKLVIRCFAEDVTLIKSIVDFPFLHFENYNDYVKLCKTHKAVIQTRHDSDDWMSPLYLAKIQEIYSQNIDKSKLLIHFQPTRLDYHTQKLIPLPEYNNKCLSGFLTLCQDPDNIIHSVYEHSHTDMYKITPNIIKMPEGFVKYWIHGKNDSLQPREVRLKQFKF